jgi:hypothetical protein
VLHRDMLQYVMCAVCGGLWGLCGGEVRGKDEEMRRGNAYRAWGLDYVDSSLSRRSRLESQACF